MVAFNQVNTVGELEVFIHVVSIKYLLRASYAQNNNLQWKQSF